MRPLDQGTGKGWGPEPSPSQHQDRLLRSGAMRDSAIRGAPVNGDHDTALGPPVGTDSVVAPAAPPGNSGHQPPVSEFRVFKPPVGLSTWDSSPFPETVVPARRNWPARSGGARHRPGRPRLAARPWPLLAVLLVQAALSARLLWSNTAFQDEALYLRAGHLEWARWLHRAPIPDFPAYFSGAPVVYPPLGALADSVGGLAAARILSLCFMLGVTTLLWGTAARLYGQRAALLATALFATLAGTQFLGAFATYDAMALFLLALAAWLGVRSADARAGPGQFFWWPRALSSSPPMP